MSSHVPDTLSVDLAKCMVCFEVLHSQSQTTYVQEPSAVIIGKVHHGAWLPCNVTPHNTVSTRYGFSSACNPPDYRGDMLLVCGHLIHAACMHRLAGAHLDAGRPLSSLECPMCRKRVTSESELFASLQSWFWFGSFVLAEDIFDATDSAAAMGLLSSRLKKLDLLDIDSGVHVEVLTYAAKHGRNNMVAFILPLINLSSKHPRAIYRALVYAANAGSVDIIDILLFGKYVKTVQGYTSLYKSKTVRTPERYNNRLLRAAIEAGHIPAAKTLLGHRDIRKTFINEVLVTRMTSPTASASAASTAASTAASAAVSVESGSASDELFLYASKLECDYETILTLSEAAKALSDAHVDAVVRAKILVGLEAKAFEAQRMVQRAKARAEVARARVSHMEACLTRVALTTHSNAVHAGAKRGRG